MHEFLRRSRWILAGRGLLAIAFGLAALLWPGQTLRLLMTLVGAYVLADGLLGALVTVRHRQAAPGLWWAPLLEGLCGIAAGLVAILWPALTASAFVVILGVWGLATGITEVLIAYRMHQEMGPHLRTPGLYALGFTSGALGIGLFVFPQVGVLILTWLVGLFTLLSGVLLLQLSSQLHRRREV